MPQSMITSIIAHIDHGKTTLLDSIIASTGYFSKSLAGDLRYLDNRKDEQERGITMKISPIKVGSGHVFIDTPGHVDFEHLIFSSSMISENHLILIDVNEGITPRTYSLVRFINKKRTVLVMNKIDKCIDFEMVELILHQMNGLLGEEIFKWEDNNIILSSAMLGAGVSFSTFKFSPKNTLKQAFKAFKALNEKIEMNEISSIVEKYKIKFPTKKIIFSTVMPLHEAVFGCINNIKETDKTDVSGFEPNSSFFEIENDFYSIKSTESPSFVGIVTSGILKNRGEIKKENILMIVKVLKGTIKKEDCLYCSSEDASQMVTIDAIFDFTIDKFNEVSCFEGPGLILIQGDFIKNSVISSFPTTFYLKKILTPFYASKVVLKNLDDIERFKSTIRLLAYTEQNLKVKLNKFSEFEFRCSGNVQFEKICYDLQEYGFEFIIKDPKKDFRETATNTATLSLNDQERMNIQIRIGPASDFESMFNDRHNAKRDPRGNIILVEGAEENNIIESVIDIFVGSGPLIKESITNTFFYIKSVNEIDIKFFNVLKNELEAVYLKTEPRIIPLCFNARLSVTKDYNSSIYVCLQKNDCLIESEDYNEDTEFTVINCKVPQFSFNGLIDEIKMKSRGTAYLEVEGSEYLDIGNFSHVIPEIRREKGLFTDEKIIDDPEKQRTLKR